MALTFNRYGKARVRVLRLERDGLRHQARELTVEAMLTGGFERAFTEGDNRAVVATDTIKNIVQALARDHVAAETEVLLAHVATFLLERYPQVERAEVTGRETRWRRLDVGGRPHDHAFTLDGNGQPFARVFATRAEVTRESGLKGFTFMKTTGSGWADFHADEYRTLPDTDDRILATAMDATWTWARAPSRFDDANARILDAMLSEFATTFSRGAQDSMYRMGEAALAAVPEIATVKLALPNKHHLPVDLTRFGRDNPGVVFLPTDEPHGQIEAVISRGAGSGQAT